MTNATQRKLKVMGATGGLPTSVVACVALFVIAACVLVSVRSMAAPTAVPHMIRKGDIQIWDEQYLRGEPKGWKVPADYHEVFGRGGAVPSGIRFGRFGLLSGRHLYTTWRPIAPLRDEVYAEGKTTIFDTHVSELLMPSFEIKLDYITFLISGGNMPNEACINLLIDGKVVRTATGRNDDLLKMAAFDVKALKGKTAQIQVLDTCTKVFGYITVDCICQSPGTKGALRVIAALPSQANRLAGQVITTSGTLEGETAIAAGHIQIGKQAVALDDLLLLKTGVSAAADTAGKRVELVSGDVLMADVLGLEKETLRIRHALFGDISVKLSHVAQAIFMPGPSINAEPGVLLHSKGTKIPGELMWIREDNIAIKSTLGVLPLPRARVRGYVFSKMKPDALAVDTVVLSDGSALSGPLSMDQEKVVLSHSALGELKLELKYIARIVRKLEGVTPLAHLREQIKERTGAIPPPAPQRVQDASGQALRLFPRTVIRYTLPPSKDATAKTRRLRATLVPVANSLATINVQIVAGDGKWTFTIAPNTVGQSIDLDLGEATEIEITTDAANAVSYPSSIEWHNAFIMEGNSQ
jgi:hypothetical protein